MKKFAAFYRNQMFITVVGAVPHRVSGVFSVELHTLRFCE